MNSAGLWILFGLYLLVAALYLVSFVLKRRGLGRLAFSGFVFALLVNTYLFARRWMETGQPPLQTLYETLIFFTWTTAFTYILLELVYKWRLAGAAVAGLCAALILRALVADRAITPLSPALKSPYFVPHVVSFFIAYAALAIAFIASSIHLIRGYLKERSGLEQSTNDVPDPYTFKAINLGLPFLTLGLVLGAFWARDAWGAYWNWDPKETWTLITWLIYFIYLHLRRVKGWRGKRACWLSVLGFLALLFTYLGINLLPTAWTSQHIYL
jgi:cytochrome c-type biogenesis protein CcsB